MDEPNNNQASCLNCNTPSTENFCQNCGQSTSLHRITFRETFNDFFSSTFALEGPLLSTIRLLIVNPGKLFREFIGGRRKPFYKPVTFFVLLTAVYIIIRALIQYDPLEEQMAALDENAVEKVQKFQKAARFMVANINNIMFFLVFSIGINHKLFFRKKNNLAEYVTIGFYIAGIYTLFGLLQMLVNVYLFKLPNQVALLFLFFLLFYTAISYHQKKSFWAVSKYVLISLFSTLLYVVLGFGFSFLMV